MGSECRDRIDKKNAHTFEESAVDGNLTERRRAQFDDNAAKTHETMKYEYFLFLLKLQALLVSVDVGDENGECRFASTFQRCNRLEVKRLWLSPCNTRSGYT